MQRSLAVPLPLGVSATVRFVGVLDVIGHGLRDSFLMAWSVVGAGARVCDLRDRASLGSA